MGACLLEACVSLFPRQYAAALSMQTAIQYTNDTGEEVNAMQYALLFEQKLS